MKIGLDIHGVIDKYPSFFSYLTKKLIKNNEIHIITGQQWKSVKPIVSQANISYTHHFSIVDYHMSRSINTPMWQDDKQNYWMPPEVWNKSKGDYISKNNIKIHFDDSIIYANFIPKNCIYIVVPKNDFDVNFYQTILYMLK